MLVGHFQAHEGGPGMLCTSQRCRVQEPARFYQFYHIYLDIFISAFLDILWVPKILYGVVLIMNDLCSQQVTWFQKGQCHRQRLCDSRWRPAEEPWRFPPHMMQSPWWFFLDTVITATCSKDRIGRCLILFDVAPATGSSNKTMKTTQLGSTWFLWSIGCGHPLVYGWGWWWWYSWWLWVFDWHSVRNSSEVAFCKRQIVDIPWTLRSWDHGRYI